jgi:hypothetical protein
MGVVQDKPSVTVKQEQMQIKRMSALRLHYQVIIQGLVLAKSAAIKAGVPPMMPIKIQRLRFKPF